MRPGRLTPENLSTAQPSSIKATSFNEAGAINPGKPKFGSSSDSDLGCFNEAGAINPGKPHDRAARNARLGDASMRPGRLTPENQFSTLRPCLKGLPLQ